MENGKKNIKVYHWTYELSEVQCGILLLRKLPWNALISAAVGILAARLPHMALRCSLLSLALLTICEFVFEERLKHYEIDGEYVRLLFRVGRMSGLSLALRDLVEMRVLTDRIELKTRPFGSLVLFVSPKEKAQVVKHISALGPDTLRIIRRG